jgi:hypothetical protein
MIHSKLLVATTILAAVASTACSDTTAPTQAGPGQGDLSFRRSGTLHVEKDCRDYHGLAGEICTITSSNLKAIKVRTRIIYASDAVGASLNTDVVLDLPGPGNNKAFGHCSIILAPLIVGARVGRCSISGGTGKFTHLRASVDVTYLGGPNFAWDGPYSFSPHD